MKPEPPSTIFIKFGDGPEIQYARIYTAEEYKEILKSRRRLAADIRKSKGKK